VPSSPGSDLPPRRPGSGAGQNARPGLVERCVTRHRARASAQGLASVDEPARGSSLSLWASDAAALRAGGYVDALREAKQGATAPGTQMGHGWQLLDDQETLRIYYGHRHDDLRCNGNLSSLLSGFLAIRIHDLYVSEICGCNHA